MAHYQGSAMEGEKAKRLAKAREEAKKEFDTRKSKLDTTGSGPGLASLESGFATQDLSYAEQFKTQTIGLVTADEFKKKRQMVEQMALLEASKKEKIRQQAKKRKEKERSNALGSLSFDLAEDGEEGPAVPKIVKKKKTTGGMKDPTATTFFLPDKERDSKERELRETLEREFKDTQDKTKSEPIEITFSYWDGSGHRRSIEVNKGTRVDQFLEKARKDLSAAFHELRGVSAENLMYIKEDLIIPHHYTFYDFIVTKARGKSGPLFHFDVHDDVRLVNDSRVEKDESHAGKVMTRAWYERNKHIFPANRWEVYDPSKSYEGYTIR